MTLHFQPVSQPTMGIDATRAAVKEAWRLAMNAATKTAAMFSAMADAETDPGKERALKHAAQCWQNTAQAAYQNWSKS